jgi:fructoselysine 6-phosphate deglycase
MAADIDRQAYLKSLERALIAKDEAAQLGLDLAKADIRRLYLVGCGSPYQNMASLKYWLERDAKKLEIGLYYPAEFINATPLRLDENTLVVLASFSGGTPETVAVAEFLKTKPVMTVGITQKPDSLLAKSVQHALTFGETSHGFHATFMVLVGLLSAIMQAVECWPYTAAILSSLDHYPCVLVDSQEANEVKATEYARIYKDDNYMMLLGAGPCFINPYVYGVCVLMESQWMRVYPCNSAEFFHGPFEAIDENTPLIIFLGEDPSRPETERVVRFARKITERLMIYDSREYGMDGIDLSVRAIFAPYIMEAVVERVASHLAIWHKQPLETRRYMWKSAY